MSDFIKINRRNYFIINACFFICFISAFFLFQPTSSMAAGEVVLNDSAVSCNGSNVQVNLTWSSILAGTPTYYILRKIQGDISFTQIDVTNNTFYVDTTAVSGKTYVYQIRAEKGSDIYYTDEKIALPVYCPPTYLPSTKSCQADGPHINLLWTAVSGDLSTYEIYRKDPGETVFLPLPTGSYTATSYNDGPDLIGAGSYYYYIKSIWQDGNSAFENTNTEEIAPACPPTLTLASSCLSDTAPGGPVINLNWNKLRGVQKYQIYRKTPDQTSPSLLTEIFNEATVNYDDKLAESLPGSYYNGGTIYYYVKAVWLTEQRDSSVLQIDIPQCKPYLAVTNNCDIFGMMLSWTSTKGATHYNIYRDGAFLFQSIGIANTAYTDGLNLVNCPGQICAHNYSIQAILSIGDPLVSNTVPSSIDCATIIPPSPPPDIKISNSYAFCENGESKIKLEWQPSNNVTYYTVYRNGAGVVNLLETLYINSGVQVDYDYTYTVTAFGKGGTFVDSQNSYTATAINCSTPSIPTLSLTPGCDTGAPFIKLSWLESTNAYSYEIWRGASADNLNLLISFNKTAPEFASRIFQDNNVLPSTVYYYKIIARGPPGTGADGLPIQSESAVNSKTTYSCLPTVPLLTLNRVCVLGAPEVNLSWVTDKANTKIYEIFRKDVSETAPIKTINDANTTAWQDSAVASLSSYEYKVEAVGYVSTSRATEGYKNIFTYDCSPPGNFTLSDATVCQGPYPKVNLSWTQSSNATSYNLYRRLLNLDDSLNQQTNIYSITTHAAGVLDTALSFDGFNDYAQIPDNPILRVGNAGADFSAEFWLYLRQGNTGSWRNIMHKGSADANRTFAMWMRPDDNRIHYRISTTANWNEGGDSITTVPLNTWSHIAYIKKGNILKLYINKNLSSVILAGQSTSNNGPIYIGKDPWSNGANSLIDQVKIYKRALSDIEVYEHYDNVYNNEADLIGAWLFNEGTGQTAADSSGNGNNGILGSNIAVAPEDPQWISFNGFTEFGRGRALNFNNNSAYISVPNSDSLNPTKITTEAWIYPTSFNYYGNIINKRDPAQYILRLYNQTGRVDGYVYVSGGWRYCTTNLAVSLNQWNHVASTYDGSIIRVYINGQEGCNSSFAGNISSGDSTLRIGSYSTGVTASERFRGNIDEARVYGRALTAQEIQEHNQAVYNNEAELRGLWHFDEGSGTAVSDSSNNGNNGTIIGAAWVESGLQAGKKYNWRTIANGIGGQTAVSTNPITVSNCPPTKPGLKLEPVCSAPNVPAVNLAWSYPYGAGTVEIYRQGAVNPITTVANNTDPTLRKFTDNNSGTGLAGLTGHTYWVKTINSAGQTESDHLPITTLSCIAPTKPENLFAVFSCSGSYPQVKLNWDASLNTSYYTVYRKDIATSITTTQNTTANSFTDTYSAGVRVNSNYEYYVRPFSLGGLPGPDSDVKVITTGYCAPSTLSLTALTTSCVSFAPVNNLIWSDATDFNTANYEIYRNGTALADKIATVAKGTLSYLDNSAGLLNLTNYTYYIKAIGPTGLESPSFAQAGITTYSCGIAPPAPVLSLEPGSPYCEDNIPHAKFSWNNAANAYSYNLYRDPDTDNLVYPTVKSVLLDHGDYALDFDGSNDYINCGNDASLKIINSQTYEFWIKPYNFSARRNPINKAYGGEGTITIETNGALSYYWGIAGADGGTYQGHGSSITIAANTWTHIAHVRDIANKKMIWYINGAANNPIAPSYNAAVASANNLLIGSGYAGPIYGQMDGVRIYARALTAAEVSEHYQGIYKNETELRGVWHFNEGSGNIASDSSGKGNNGSLINMNNNSWKFPSNKLNFTAPLQSNKTYKYKIKAMGVDRESDFSNEVIVNTGACLTAPVLTNNDICSYYNKPITLLYWPNQKNVTEYKLYKDGALFESKAPADYISSDGFIKHWLLIGGFSYAGTDAAAILASLNTDYLGGELKVKPRAGESVGGKTWFDYSAPASNYTDFTLTSAPMSALTPKTYASAYAFAYIYSPIAQTVQLRIGSDDGVKVFLNGSVIYTNNTQRGASPDQDINAINLLAGMNTLLIKVQQGAGGWGLYARITDSLGNNAINNITTWDSAVAFGNNPTYNVKAKILDEETDFSNSAVSTPPNCLPADPGLTAAPGCSASLSPKIVLNWNPDPNNQTEYWSVYKKREGDAFVHLLNISPPAISYTDNNIESGINYEYYLEAWGIADKTFSTVKTAQAPFCYPSPSKPVVTVTPLCAGYTPRMQIDWSATTDTVFYDVLRKNITAGEVVFSNLFTGLSSATFQKVDINVDEASAYQYIVKAIGSGTDNSNSSDPSDEAVALGCSTIPPFPPVLSLINVVSTGDYVFVSLRWIDSGNEEKYEVLRNGASIKTLVQSVDYNEEDFFINHLDNTVIDGESYDYQILSINANGSTNSNIITVAVPIAVPGDFTLTADWTADRSKIYLNWTEAKTTVAGADVSYQVLRDSSASFTSPTVICDSITAEPFECYDNDPSFSEKYYKAVASNNGGTTDSNIKTIMFMPTWREVKP